MTTATLTQQEVAFHVPSQAAAYEALERIRWCNGIAECPHCGESGAYYIGSNFRTTHGSISQRRVWACSDFECGGQFSVLTGSVLHGTKMSLPALLAQIVAPLHVRGVMREHDVAWRTAKRIMDAAESIRADGLVQVRQTDFTAFGRDPGCWVPGSGRPLYLDAQREGGTIAHDFVSLDGEWGDPTFEAVLERLHDEEIETRQRVHEWNIDHSTPMRRGDTSDLVKMPVHSSTAGGMAHHAHTRKQKQKIGRRDGRRPSQKPKAAR